MICFSRQCLQILGVESMKQRQMYSLRKSFVFKSALSLENLYPKSNLKLYTPNFVPEDPSVKFNGFIPINELSITYSASSGPGGQNVNRVNTKVDLRFNVKSASWLSDEIKEKLVEQQANKINKEGFLIVRSDITRSQQLNLADALEKLRNMIRETIKPVTQLSPETEEKIRKNKIKAARQRIFEKKLRSQIKQNRQTSEIE